MAEFGINSTQLSEAQGQGTQPLAPVQEQVSKLGISPVFGEIGEIFAKGLKNNAKEQAEARKNAILGEYLNKEKSLGDALTSGQLTSSRVSSESRANFTKFIAAHPEYVQELTQARASVYGGTEVGEAQKKIDAEQKQRESDINAASGMGYNFYPGMSDAAKDANIDAYKAARRVELQFQQDSARAAENRAAGSHKMSVDDYVAKENAVAGAREVASKNFDSVIASANDLIQKMQTGMPPEQAMMTHNANISRIKAGLNAITGKFPDMAAPWVRLFDDIDVNIKAQLDPNKKSADELKQLQDRYQSLITTAKLAAVEKNPRLLKAVVASDLFKGDAMVTLDSSPAIKEWLFSASGTDPALPKPAQVVGTAEDTVLFNQAKTAISNLQSGKIPADRKEAATQEAVSVVNTLLEQTAQVDGSLDPKAMSQASKFFSSTEFGKLAVEGKIDKQTAANAQHIFQVKYEPAVRDAIITKLEDANISQYVNVKVVGGQVTFGMKPGQNTGILESVGNALNPFNLHKNLAAGEGTREAKGLKEAEAGLNQLIRLHAHLEGTTDYAKYWETNKHVLMPSIFPDPAKLKPGQVVDGHKYTGGNYRDRSNWIAEPTKPAK